MGVRIRLLLATSAIVGAASLLDGSPVRAQSTGCPSWPNIAPSSVHVGTDPCGVAAGAALATEITRAVNAESGIRTAAVPLAGGTMTGPLVLPGAPTSALQAAPKSYVDAETTRAQMAEGTLTSSVSAEVTRAQNAEALLASLTALATEASTARNASNLTSGTVPTARLPAASSSVAGIVPSVQNPSAQARSVGGDASADMVTATGSSTPRTQADMAADRVYAKAWGVVPGALSGAALTNNTNALLAAIAWAGASGKKYVVLDYGTFWVNATVLLNLGGVHLVGQGDGHGTGTPNTVLQWHGAAGGTVVQVGNSWNAGNTQAAVWNAGIDGVYIDCNNTARRGLYVANAWGFDIETFVLNPVAVAGVQPVGIEIDGNSNLGRSKFLGVYMAAPTLPVGAAIVPYGTSAYTTSPPFPVAMWTHSGPVSSGYTNFSYTKFDFIDIVSTGVPILIDWQDHVEYGVIALNLGAQPNPNQLGAGVVINNAWTNTPLVTNAASTGTTLSFASTTNPLASAPSIASGWQASIPGVTGLVSVTGATPTSVTLASAETVASGATITFYPPVAVAAPGAIKIDEYNGALPIVVEPSIPSQGVMAAAGANIVQNDVGNGTSFPTYGQGVQGAWNDDIGHTYRLKTGDLAVLANNPAYADMLEQYYRFGGGNTGAPVLVGQQGGGYLMSLYGPDGPSAGNWLLRMNKIASGNYNLEFAQIGFGAGLVQLDGGVRLGGNGYATIFTNGSAINIGGFGLENVGTITSGAWNGAAIPVAYGGTGAATAAAALANLAAAPLASPALTGTPTAPTPTAGDNTTKLATTAFVASAVSSGTSTSAPLASPALTGAPTAPTQAAGDATTKIATDAFVQTAIGSAVGSAYGSVLLFGTGSDGTNTAVGCGAVSTTVTLTRDVHCASATPTASAVIKTAGYHYFVAGTLDTTSAAAGAYQCNGSNGSNAAGSTGGGNVSGTFASFVAQSIQGGYPGLGGPAGGTGVGAVVASSGNGIGEQIGGIPGIGGVGGAAGATLGGSPGALATATAVSPQFMEPIIGAAPMQVSQAGTGVLVSLDVSVVSGTPGGAGAGDGTNAGGAGGGAAGGPCPLLVNAAALVRGSATGIFQSKGAGGGNGGNGAAGNAAGGGGGPGSGGGFADFLFGAVSGSTNSNIVDVSGGTGGTGGNGSGTGVGGTGGKGGNSGQYQEIVLATATHTASAYNQAGSAATTASTSTGTPGGAGATLQGAL